MHSDPRGFDQGFDQGVGMTKSELIDAMAARGELTKARAELVVNCVFDAMTEALQRGEGIEDPRLR